MFLYKTDFNFEEPNCCSTWTFLPEVEVISSTAMLFTIVTDVVSFEVYSHSTSSYSLSSYSTTPTVLCQEDDVAPFQVDSIETYINETFTYVLGPFCSYRGLDLTYSLIEQNTISLPDGLYFDSGTLVFNGTSNSTGTKTIEVKVTSPLGQKIATF